MITPGSTKMFLNQCSARAMARWAARSGATRSPGGEGLPGSDIGSLEDQEKGVAEIQRDDELVQSPQARRPSDQSIDRADGQVLAKAIRKVAELEVPLGALAASDLQIGGGDCCLEPIDDRSSRRGPAKVPPALAKESSRQAPHVWRDRDDDPA